MSRIKAVIFDVDGVLIDAKEWHYNALNEALELFGYRISRFEHVATYDGLPTRTKLNLLSEQCGFPRSLHDFVNRMKQQYTLRIAERSCRPQANHLDTLSRLQSQGYKLGVASNSIRSTVDRLMEKSGLANYLSFSLSNQDVAKPKPDPEIYQKAIQLAAVDPDECVILEDNPYGVQAATHAMAHVLKVNSTQAVNYANIMAFIAKVEAESEHDNRRVPEHDNAGFRSIAAHDVA